MNTFPSGVIAVVRSESERTCRVVVEGLALGGVTHIEVTTTTPGYRSVVAGFSDESDIEIGVGTVMTADQVSAAAEDGAAYVVSPDCNDEVVNAASRFGIPSAAGALTPTEVRRAFDSGAAVVKVFPVRAVGGVAYIKDLLGPLPEIPLIVSGGIDTSEVQGYLTAGVHAVCLGGALIDKTAASTGNAEKVAKHAREALAQINRES